MEYFNRLEEVIRENLNHRGMDKACLFGQMEGAANELIKSNTIVIVTGFVIKDRLVGETDGPLGTISIANALSKLGKNIIIVTDIYSEEIIKAALKVIDFKCIIEVIKKGNEVSFCKNILKKYKPDCLLSVERPGQAEDGNIYSMRGECLSHIIPSVDNMFKDAKMQGISTIGIGDGGNEIGMGKIKQYVVNNVEKGNIIASLFATDYLILAGVSNWGAHALVAAISLIINQDLLYSDKTEVQVLNSIVEAGAVDGLTKEQTLTVDGLSLEDNMRIFKNIKLTVKDRIILEKGVS